MRALNTERPKVYEPPPDWGTDGLSGYLKAVAENQHATFVHMKEQYRLLDRIDASFLKIGTNLLNPKDAMGPLFLFRSHAAYRAACGAAMAGQVAETFVLLRSCLEYAGYGLRINHNPALGPVWLNRHESDAAIREMKKQFSYRAIRDEIQSCDGRLGQIFDDLYQRTIDFGGHPNERAMMSSMKITEGDGRTSLLQLYLHPGDMPMQHAMKSTAQAGATSLHLFQWAFKERFELLGIRAELEELRKVL